MPHLESKTKLIITASVNWYINPKNKTKNSYLALLERSLRSTTKIIFSLPKL